MGKPALYTTVGGLMLLPNDSEYSNQAFFLAAAPHLDGDTLQALKDRQRFFGIPGSKEEYGDMLERHWWNIRQDLQDVHHPELADKIAATSIAKAYHAENDHVTPEAWAQDAINKHRNEEGLDDTKSKLTKEGEKQYKKQSDAAKESKLKEAQKALNETEEVEKHVPGSGPGSSGQGGIDPKKVMDTEFESLKKRIASKLSLDIQSKITEFSDGTGRLTGIEKHAAGYMQIPETLTNMADLHKVDPVELKLPGFKHRLVTQSVIKLERYRVKTPTKLVLICIDGSGSMTMDSKINAIKALLLLQYEKIRDRKIILGVLQYVEYPTAHRIFDHTNLDAFHKFVDTYYPIGGGDTYVARVIKSVGYSLPKFGAQTLENTGGMEYVVVSDGQDPVDHAFTEKVSAICIEEDNPEIATAVQVSGGKYLYIPCDY